MIPQLLEGLAESSNDFLVALDTAGTIVWAEPQVMEFLGRQGGENAPLHVEDVVHVADVSFVARAVGRMLADKAIAMPAPLRLNGSAEARHAVVVSAWKLDFKDGKSLIVSFMRLEPAGAPAT